MNEPYTHAVIDFSKNSLYPRPSDLLGLIAQLTALQLGQISVVARNSQERDLQPIAGSLAGIRWIDESVSANFNFAVPQAVELLKNALSAPGLSHRILVTSYNGAVLNAAGRTATVVEPRSMKEFRFPPRNLNGSQKGVVDASDATLLPKSPANAPWKYGGISSRKESVDLLVEALNGIGAIDQRHTLTQPNVKPAMARLDGRFLGSSQANGTGGMIGTIIACAHFDGLVEIAINCRGTQFVWLTPHGKAAAVKVVEPVVTPIVTKTMDAGPAVQVENPDAEKVPVVAPEDPKKLPSPHKSRRMQEALMKAVYGPLTKARLEMYRHIGALTADGKNALSFSMLLDEAKSRLLASAVETSEPASSTNPTAASARAIVKLLRHLLPATGCFRDAAGPIPTGFRSRTAIVASIDPEWQLKADAFLLLKLVAIFDEPIFADTDVENLVGAIYHVRSGPQRRELTERVESMIIYLLDQGLIEEADRDGRRVFQILAAKTLPIFGTSAEKLRLA